MTYHYVEKYKLLAHLFQPRFGGRTRAWALYHEITNFEEEAVAPVAVGKWLEVHYNEQSGHTDGECSVCHYVRTVDNFCSHCGAKMSFEEETDGKADI